MRPLSVAPQPVPIAVVRRLATVPEAVVPVQHVEVARVVAPSVVPRQLDPVALRLMALQLENAGLRAELEHLRSA